MSGWASPVAPRITIELTAMPDRLSIHTPTLLNTIGHSAGAIIFGILLYLIFLDWRRNPSSKGMLPSVAAALALLWNVGSLVGLATDAKSGFYSDLIIAVSFSLLSFLPAVLLHILAEHSRAIVLAGYGLSISASALHFLDLVTRSVRYHYAAILIITIGFCTLAFAEALWPMLKEEKKLSGRRLAGATVLFLFAISFVHFGPTHPGGEPWLGEIALHHAGIPVALFVLLQDYRFLLLDTFLRFLVNAFLAAATVAILVFFGARFDPISEVHAEPFYAGLAFVAACIMLILFGSIRRRVEMLLTRALFLRANPDRVASAIKELGDVPGDEDHFLNRSAKLIADFIGCERFEWAGSEDRERNWVQLSLPARFARGESRSLRLGSRRGGRVFLSEDVAVLEGLLLEVSRQADRRRATEMQALVIRGELQSLQAQMNPHFLFNTLNTIYGSISRSNQLARQLILNLSDILRYSLSNDRAFIRLADEIRIVRAYLEIEEARLGPRLRTEIIIDERASEVEIPAFSIQPLIENAIKHGVAAQAGSGFVALSISIQDEFVRISISNSGTFPGSPERSGNGVSLKNVRRRLAICYGSSADFRIESDAEVTLVRFNVPAPALSR